MEETESWKEIDAKWVPPSMRRLELYNRFLGAVQTRISDCQKAMWSKFIGAGFIKEDIQSVWPEDNMRFFSMNYSGHNQSFQLRDLNLRELHELSLWLQDFIDDHKNRCPGMRGSL